MRLAYSIGGADMNRRDNLIEDHLNCVHWVIRSFIHVSPDVCSLEYDDLYQEGCIALWRAAETFDEQQGRSFTPTPFRSSATIYSNLQKS